MPSIIISRAPGMARAVARPPEGLTSRSLVPWITSVGALIRAQVGDPAARFDDRRHLAGQPGRAGPAVVAQLGQLAQRLLVALEAGRADEREHLLDPLRRRPPCRPAAWRAGTEGSATAGWPLQRLPVLDMIETSESTRSRVPGRHQLGDHPAHRGAHHVGRVRSRARRAARRRRRPCRRACRPAAWAAAAPARPASAAARGRSGSSGRSRGCRSGSRRSRAPRAGGRSPRASRSSACRDP